MTKQIANFAMQNKLLFHTFQLEKGDYNEKEIKYAKNINFLPAKWELKSYDDLVSNYLDHGKKNNYIAIRPGDKFMVVDIDSKIAHDKFKKKFPELQNTVITKSFNNNEMCGYRLHYWYEKLMIDKYATMTNKDFGFDIITDISNIFEKLDTEFNVQDILHLNNNSVESLYAFSKKYKNINNSLENKTKKKNQNIDNMETKKTNQDKKFPSLSLLEFYIKALPHADIPEYTEWLKLTWSISNSVSDENRPAAWELYKKYHSDSNKFNEQKDRKTFFRPEVDPNYKIFDFNYLKSFVRKLQGQNKISAEEIAVKIQDEYNEKIICQISNNKKIVKWFILDEYNKYTSQEIALDKIIIKSFKAENSKVTMKAVNDTKEFLKIYCQNDEIKFDENPFLLGFKTNVCDLKTGEFRKYKPEDRISLTTEYEYIKPTQENIDYLHSKLNQIYPKINILNNLHEEKETALKIFATGLIGMNIQNLFILTGKGRNGKGLICRLLSTTLGPNFAKLGNSDLLISDMKSGPNPELASLEKARLVIWTEPDSRKKINTETAKSYSGGDKLTARDVYEDKNNTTKLNHMTPIIQCNDKPALSKVDDAIASRIFAQPYRASFQDYNTEVIIDQTQNIYEFIADKDIDTDEWREIYKCAFVTILIPYCMEFINKDKMKIIKPDFIKKESESWFISSDSVTKWFNETYEQTKLDTDIIKLHELYDEFKLTDDYSNLNKMDKRKYNKKGFVELFEKSPVYKRYFHDRKKINGIDYRSILQGFKIIGIPNDNDKINFSKHDELDGDINDIDY